MMFLNFLFLVNVFILISIENLNRYGQKFYQNMNQNVNLLSLLRQMNSILAHFLFIKTKAQKEVLFTKDHSKSQMCHRFQWKQPV